uniref:Uncharacterized protein n=1 Tax=Brassica campestris TaxID=3711 RepID=M4DSG1_BRACM
MSATSAEITKVNVVSIISDGADLPNFVSDVGSDDEEDGGATKADVSRMHDEAVKENNNRKTARANRKLPATEGIDAEYVASIKKMEDLLRNSQKEILDSMTKYCTCTHARLPVDARPDNTGKSNVPGGDTTSFVVSDIIQEAMRFANKESTHTRQDPLEAYMFNEEADDIGEVVAGQDTVTNRNADGEDTVEHVIAPPLNSTETSMEDPTNVVNANQVLVSDLKEEVSEMRSDMVGLAKQLDYSQHMLQMSAKGSSTGCCSIL